MKQCCPQLGQVSHLHWSNGEMIPHRRNLMLAFLVIPELVQLTSVLTTTMKSWGRAVLGGTLDNRQCLSAGDRSQPSLEAAAAYPTDSTFHY